MTVIPSLPGDVESIRHHFALLLDSTSKDEMLEITGGSFVANDETIFGQVNRDYVQRELEWYRDMSLSVNDIRGGAPKIWRDVASPTGKINSNYGYLFYSRANGWQFDRVVEELLANPTSRRAIAIYTRPSIHTDATEGGMNDFICTNTVHYLIRGRRLEVIVNMRSNDAIFGYRNDYAWQVYAAQRVLNDLRANGMFDLELGAMTWQFGSLHIYPRHRWLVELFRDTGAYLVDVNKNKKEA